MEGFGVYHGTHTDPTRFTVFFQIGKIFEFLFKVWTEFQKFNTHFLKAALLDTSLWQTHAISSADECKYVSFIVLRPALSINPLI